MFFPQGSFLNTAATTPEEIARKRAEIAALMPQFGSARYVGEGLGQLATGFAMGRQRRKLDAQEREGRAAAGDRLNAVFGGGLTGRAQPGDFTVLGPSGTFIAAPPPPKPTENFMGKPDTIFEGGNTFGLPAAPAPQPSQPLSFGSSAMTPQEMLIAGAEARGLNPIDVATAISYETGGTFDPLIQGPTTQWGTHDGLIQFGDPQAVEHGAVFDQGVDRAWQSQLDPNNGAVWSYLESTGVQPGMGLDQIYSAINAGGINRFGASDANNGGAPGTVADKVAGMAPHRENAAKFLGGTWVPDPNGGQPVNVNSPQMTAATMPTDALMSLVMDPWQPPEVRAMAQSMLEEQRKYSDPAYTMGLRADELAIQKAEAELDALRNPKPEFTQLSAQEVAALGLPPGVYQRGPDGRIDTIEKTQAPADPIAELRARATAAGLQEGTPEFQAFMLSGGKQQDGMVIESDGQGGFRMVQGAGASGAAAKPFTESQSKDVVYATRAKGALEALDPIANALTDRTDVAAGYLPFGLGGWMQNEQYQVAKTAGDEFLQAILRKDTGAAITADEQALYGETYLPQPGDNEARLAYKAEARQRAIAAIEAGMSPAQIIAQEKALAKEQGAAETSTDEGAATGPSVADIGKMTMQDLLRIDVNTLTDEQMDAMMKRFDEVNK